MLVLAVQYRSRLSSLPRETRLGCRPTLGRCYASPEGPRVCAIVLPEAFRWLDTPAIGRGKAWFSKRAKAVAEQDAPSWLVFGRVR